MNHYLFQPEASSPPQHILLDQLLPRTQKPSSKFSEAKTPEEVASIIADDMLQSIKSTFIGVDANHLLSQ